jgi:hypothetical protein
MVAGKFYSTRKFLRRSRRLLVPRWLDIFINPHSEATHENNKNDGFLLRGRSTAVSIQKEGISRPQSRRLDPQASPNRHGDAALFDGAD